MKQRGIENQTNDQVKFPEKYDTGERDKFYAECAKIDWNPSGKNPGARGYDAVLIAYDALLWVET